MDDALKKILESLPSASALIGSEGGPDLPGHVTQGLQALIVLVEGQNAALHSLAYAIGQIEGLDGSAFAALMIAFGKETTNPKAADLLAKTIVISTQLRDAGNKDVRS